MKWHDVLSQNLKCASLPEAFNYTATLYAFVGSNQSLYRQFDDYGKGVGHHKVGQ